MFALLIGGGVVYLFLRDIREAAVLLGSIALIMLIDFSQENRTEHALEALRDLSSPRALVIRDGKHKRIAGREVVREDLVVLVEGDRVPADGTLLWQLNLSVDESLLIGESLPVRKRAWRGQLPPEMNEPGGDNLPFVYSGSLITQGQRVAQVLATGARTELGQIGKALEAVKPEKKRLQRETGRLVRVVAVVGVVLCLLAVLLYGIRWTVRGPEGSFVYPYANPGEESLQVQERGIGPRITADLIPCIDAGEVTLTLLLLPMNLADHEQVALASHRNGGGAATMSMVKDAAPLLLRVFCVSSSLTDRARSARTRCPCSEG